MPFTIDFTKIQDWESFHEDDYELAVSNAIAWASLTTGINHITEANAAEAQVRFNLAADAFGALLVRHDEETHTSYPIYLPVEAFQRRVGLRTNATPRTTASFNGAVVKELRRNAKNR